LECVQADQQDQDHDESMSRWCTWQLSLSLTAGGDHAMPSCIIIMTCMDWTGLDGLVHGTELERSL
jgi:hypothetical protein